LNKSIDKIVYFIQSKKNEKQTKVLKINTYLNILNKNRFSFTAIYAQKFDEFFEILIVAYFKINKTLQELRMNYKCDSST
jgi:hypothetical protein